MGFFGMLGNALGAGVKGMNDMVNNNIAEEALKLRKKSSYELEELFSISEKATTKRAIVVAFALQGNNYKAKELAESGNVSRRFIEGLASHDKVGREVTRLLQDWPKQY